MKAKIKNIQTNQDFILQMTTYGNRFCVKTIDSLVSNTVFVGSFKNCLKFYTQKKEYYLKNLNNNLLYEKNSLLNEVYKKNKGKLPNKRTKKPNTQDNYIGLEIEFISPLKEKAIALLLKNYKLNHKVTLIKDLSIIPHWEGYSGKYGMISEDQILSGHYGHEITILCKESELDECLKKIKLFFKEVKAKTNETCSVHVHLDMRNRNVHESFKKLVNKQKRMFKMNPQRKGNYYCKFVKTNNFDKALNIYLKKKKGNLNHQLTARAGFGWYNRYLAINPFSYQTIKTLEVRVHEGTTDTDRIKKWINFLIKTIK